MSVEDAAYRAKRKMPQKASDARRRRIDDARGYIYVLRNDVFLDGWVKIGETSRSGNARAIDINGEAGTGYPGRYRCLFEVETLDRHRAEKAVFERLKDYRQGKQELFVVEISLAEQVIREECSRINRETLRKIDEANAQRARELQQQRAAAEQRAPVAASGRNQAPQPRPHHKVVQAGIERVKRAQATRPAPSRPDPRTSGQWVTAEQAAAAWAARRTAQADRAKRDATLRPLEEPLPATASTKPNSEFRWILVLIALLGIVAVSI